MKGINTNCETNGIRHNAKDDVKVTNAQSDKITKTEEVKGTKESDTIFAGNLNLNQTSVGERQAKAQKDALKEIMDTFSREHKVDVEMQKKREHIAELEGDIKENLTEIRDLRGRGAALKETYCIEDDSEEEAELNLLKKEAETPFSLTFEEKKQVAAIKERGLTDYQAQSLGFYKRELSLEKENEASRQAQYEDNAYIKGVHKARLKQHAMVDSKKVAQGILDEAASEIQGMLVKEAVDHIDEKLEENEEKTEQNKDNHKDKQSESMKDMQSAILKGEADKRVAEHKMTRDDTKGLACDKQI